MGATDLKLDISFHLILCPIFMCKSSKGFVVTACLHKLILAMTASLCYKYQYLTYWLMCSVLSDLPQFMGVQWLSGRALDSRSRGREIEPHQRHCLVSLSKTH